MCSPRFPARPAMSALQLVVVLALLLIGMALLLPAIARIREAAMMSQSTNNLKQIALATHSYHDVYKAFPPAVGPKAGQNGPAHFHLLPYLEEGNLFQTAGGASWKNGVYGKVVSTFLDPRDQSAPAHIYKDWLATTNYAANWMVFKDGMTTLVQITDGTSNTLMFAQRYQMCNGQPTAWGYPSVYTWAPMYAYYSEGKFQSAPSQEACDPTLPQSLGRDMLVAFCDGSVRTISPAVSSSTWYYLTDPNDGIAIPSLDF